MPFEFLAVKYLSKQKFSEKQSFLENLIKTRTEHYRQLSIMLSRQSWAWYKNSMEKLDLISVEDKVDYPLFSNGLGNFLNLVENKE